MFRGCRALRRVSLTAPVALINSEAFCDCSALRSIDLSALLPDAEIGNRAFARTGLVEVILPAKLNVISYGAFEDCISLTSVRLPQELDSLRDGVFEGCTSLRALALGDVGSPGRDPGGLLGGVKLDRLELIGTDLASLDRLSTAIGTWLSDGAAIVSAEFAGRTLCGRLITTP
jgi:hypothetical protein